VRARDVLGALRRSGGGAVAVAEAEIAKALFDLSRIGLYAEPTSALAAAGLTKLIERGVVQPGETTVVVLTGSGLKATRRVGELLGAP
jgi:threonine synthase